MKVLVTGGAGFIGSHVAKKLIGLGHEITIVDNLNSYYSPELKRARLKFLLSDQPFRLHKIDIAEYEKMEKVFAAERFDAICHLAAQAGVRYSLTHPEVYERTNISGTLSLLRLAAKYGVPKFVFASSSSVYGLGQEFPSRESYSIATPISLYAATKIACEAMVHAYAHTHQLKSTVLRFFNVYGPWVRPDMALFLFTQRILADRPIDVFNNGNSEKDFTYVDDIVEGVVAAMAWNSNYEVFNLGNSQPVLLRTYIELLEKELGRTAEKNYLPLQLGDVPKSFADIGKARRLLGYHPQTPVEEGVARFVAWYRQYAELLGLDRM